MRISSLVLVVLQPYSAFGQCRHEELSVGTLEGCVADAVIICLLCQLGISEGIEELAFTHLA
jgi:hypothetical protein